MKRMSIVVPSYNEAKTIPLFYEACLSALTPLDVEPEWWFVDDGSTDETLAEVKALRDRDMRVHYISFSRNFGKESAMFAGLEASTGDYIAVMDADLQDPPAMLGEMLSVLENEGYDCAATRRVTRKGEPRLRSFFARMFYRLINRISKIEIMDGARDFRLMSRQMVDAILSLKEVSRFSKGIFSWVGFKTKWLEYENVQRAAGETKWSFWSRS
jgi:glucosyltransferase